MPLPLRSTKNMPSASLLLPPSSLLFEHTAHKENAFRSEQCRAKRFRESGPSLPETPIHHLGSLQKHPHVCHAKYSANFRQRLCSLKVFVSSLHCGVCDVLTKRPCWGVMMELDYLITAQSYVLSIFFFFFLQYTIFTDFLSSLHTLHPIPFENQGRVSDL